MTETKYRIIFKGEIAEGKSADDVKQKLASVLKADTAKIDTMFSGQPKIVKRNATKKQCIEIQKAFEHAGAICTIEAEIDKEEEALQPNSTSPNASHLPPPLPKPKPATQEQPALNYPTRGPDEKFCESCGAIMKINMLACPNCGKKSEKSNSMPGCAIAAIAVGVIFMVLMIIGILAAIAIPNFISYRNKAYQSAVKTELISLMNAEETYYETNRRYTANFDDLDYTTANPNVYIDIMSADADCYQAKGTMEGMRNELWIDCYGNEQLTKKGASPEEIPEDEAMIMD